MILYRWFKSDLPGVAFPVDKLANEAFPNGNARSRGGGAD
jgi:hypothetical protein